MRNLRFAEVRYLSMQWMLTFVVMGFFILCTSATGAPIKSGSFPVPLRIDGDKNPISTSLYIKCNYRHHGQAFHAFKDLNMDVSGITLCELMQSMSKKNFSRCAELSSLDPSLSSEEKANYRKKVAKIAERYSSFFDGSMDGRDINKVIISKQFMVGNDVIFIWGANSGWGKDKKGPLRRWFRFEKKSTTEVLWNGGKVDPLAVLLTHMMQYSAETPGKFLPKKAGEFEYNFPIPGTTKGYAVLLQFNGKMYDFDVYGSEMPGPQNEALNFYHQACQAFKVSPGNLADFYTPVSRERMLKWLMKMTPENQVKYQEAVLNAGRTVRFIIDADPVFIVFYTTKNSKNFRYEYVVRYPSTGKLKLTNFFSHNYLDDLFADMAFRNSFSSFILADESGQSIEE